MTTELKKFRPLRGQNFYRADPTFGQLLDDLCDPQQRSQLEEKLQAFADQVSNQWDALAEEAALDYEGPLLKNFDALGNSVDEVCLPAPVKTIRREVVEAGIFKNETQLEQMAKVYLLAHLGECGVVCPLACTEGLIRVIQGVGSDFLKENYLPKILSAETPLAGAQFITEQDMGSDVGALTTRAVPAENGQWTLHGEKWFCSAIDEYFLIAARPEGAAEGTEGVAIFFMPRVLDGQPNNIRIKRLKNKIGTRELPTAEVELEGAVAYSIGDVGQGFKSLMNYVINTSRIMNAASALGVMGRANLEARNYAEQRSAFGNKISSYPLVMESLDKIAAISSARRALYFSTIARIDRNPIADLGSDEAYWQRFLINLCKYRTAIGATECSREAILVFGGNGTIESFSILPRLYRDSMVLETWEGTHNTLALQIARDGLRFPFRDAFEDFIGEPLKTLAKSPLRETADWLSQNCEQTLPAIAQLSDPAWAARNARILIDRLGSCLELLLLARLAVTQGDLTENSRLVAAYQREIESSQRKFY